MQRNNFLNATHMNLYYTDSGHLTIMSACLTYIS